MANKPMNELTEEQRVARRAYQKAYMAKYYYKNKEKMISQVMANQKKNSEHINEMQRNRRAANPEQFREYTKNYNASLRSPESQAKYEERAERGAKHIGPRDEEWHKKFKKGRKDASVWKKRYDKLKEKMEKDSIKVVCVFGNFGKDDFVLEKACPGECDCDICKDSFRVVKI